MRLHASLSLLVGLLGCASDSTLAPRARPGLQIVSGRDVRDTISTHPSDSLVLELRDASGKPIAGARIHVDNSPGENRGAVYFRSGFDFGAVVDVVTRVDGRASLALTFGTRAGIAVVRATAETSGFSDSTSMTVLPGAGVKLIAGPVDTAVWVSRSAQLRAVVVDRWANARSDAVKWSERDPSVVRVTAGGLVTGMKIGRGSAKVVAGSLSDSLYVSVVPEGMIAAGMRQSAVGETIPLLVFNTDGTAARQLPLGPGANCGQLDIRWARDGSGVIYTAPPRPTTCWDQRLMFSPLSGGDARQIHLDTPPPSGERTPIYSPDGSWIYFSGAPGGQNGELWRTRADGSGAERIGPPADWFDVDHYPSPSPDGRLIVFSSNRQYRSNTDQTLRILDLSSRSVRDMLVDGFAPSWSPRGDVIAFALSNRYYLVRPDGSDLRRLVDGPADAIAVSWSQDGRYVIGRISGRLAIIEVATGMVLPLGWTSGMTYPAWRP
jgi:hypothetical protein